MDAAGVFENLKRIYAQFEIPSNLQLHMCRSAAVGELVYDHLGERNDERENTVAALLLHDLGNIVKFKLDHEHANLLGKEAAHIDHWRKVKEETIKRYGSDDDHYVTSRMMQEAGIGRRIMYIVDNYWTVGMLDSSHDLPLKICGYGDNRAGPFGVISVDQRFDDLLTRYKGDPREEHFRRSRAEVLKLERYVIGRTDLKPEQINDTTIAPYLAKRVSGLGLA